MQPHKAFRMVANIMLCSKHQLSVKRELWTSTAFQPHVVPTRCTQFNSAISSSLSSKATIYTQSKGFRTQTRAREFFFGFPLLQILSLANLRTPQLLSSCPYFATINTRGLQGNCMRLLLRNMTRIKLLFSDFGLANMAEDEVVCYQQPCLIDMVIIRSRFMLSTYDKLMFCARWTVSLSVDSLVPVITAYSVLSFWSCSVFDSPCLYLVDC